MKLYRSIVGCMVTDGRLTVSRAEGESTFVDGVSMVRMGQGTIVIADNWFVTKYIADLAAAGEILRISDCLRQQSVELCGYEHVDRVHAAASRVVDAWRDFSRGNPDCPQTLSNAVLSLISALPASGDK